MLENNKGVTLTMLVVTIIVIIILAGTTIVASDLLIKDTKSKNITTDMILVQGKVEELYDKYEFNGTAKADYVGTNVTDVTQYGATNSEFWYKWDKNNLKSLGFDENMLSNGGEFIVNYDTGEVIYTLGIEDDSGVVKYTLSDILNK